MWRTTRPTICPRVPQSTPIAEYVGAIVQSRYSGCGESGMSKLLQKFGKKAARETAVADKIDYEQLIVDDETGEVETVEQCW